MDYLLEKSEKKGMLKRATTSSRNFKSFEDLFFEKLGRG